MQQCLKLSYHKQPYKKLTPHIEMYRHSKCVCRIWMKYLCMCVFCVDRRSEVMQPPLPGCATPTCSVCPTHSWMADATHVFLRFSLKLRWYSLLNDASWCIYTHFAWMSITCFTEASTAGIVIPASLWMMPVYISHHSWILSRVGAERNICCSFIRLLQKNRFN